MSEEQITSGIDQFMIDGRTAYSGEEETAAAPAEPEPAAQDPAATEKAEENREPENPETAPEPEEKPSETITQPDKPEEKEKNFRFKSHEEAEEGYRNILSRVTRAEQEAARVRKEMEYLKDVETFQQVIAQNEKAYLDFSTERNQKALLDIDSLDPDDPEHNKKVARIWAEANRDIRRYEEQLNIAARKFISARQRQLQQQPAAPAPIQQQPRPDNAATPDPVDFVRNYISKQGLQPDDRMFWAIAGQAPTSIDGKPIDLNEQIKWAVEETKKLKASIREEHKKELESIASKTGRRTAEGEVPLGRGGIKPSPGKAEAERPISLSEAVERALESRRL